MLAHLYLSIEEKLKSITDDDGKPLIKHFDLWNKQVDFIEQESPFDTPAVFIEFRPMQWRTLGNRVQDCELTVKLHIVTRWFGNTAEYTPAEQRTQAMNYLSLPSRLVYELQTFHINPTENFGGCNAWVRISSTVNHNHERYVDSVEEYRCNLRDISACRKYTPVMVTPTITTEPSKEV